MKPRFRRLLAEILERTGRLADADSVRALLPPRSAPLPPCTPGGNWTGCPVE
jgi:hypothetical protein